MTKITITEALAELKTIDARVEKKQQFISQYLTRETDRRDPLEKSGGTFEAIRRELQAIRDLHQRKVNIRLAINRVNAITPLRIGDQERSISEWIVWRRDIAPSIRSMLRELATAIKAARQPSATSTVRVDRGRITQSSQGETTRPVDIIVNVDEAELSANIEQLEETLGTLDGQLSLKNATTLIDVDGGS